MGIIGTLFLIIFSLAALLIIALVLLQDEQGEGFGGLFGGGGNTNSFVNAGTNVLSRATAILGVLFMVSSMAVGLVYKSDNSSDSVIEEFRRSAGSGQDWFLEESPDSDSSEEISDALEFSSDDSSQTPESSGQ